MLINLETEYKISMVSVNNTNVSDKGKLKQDEIYDKLRVWPVLNISKLSRFFRLVSIQ